MEGWSGVCRMRGWLRRCFRFHKGQYRKLKAPATALEAGKGGWHGQGRGTRCLRKLGLGGWSLHFLLSVRKQRDDCAVQKIFMNVLWKPMCFFSYVLREKTVPSLLGFPALAHGQTDSPF